jgi:hypothetical protein
MSTDRAAGISMLVFAVAGVVWFATELAPASAGFADTDNPAVMLDFLREHPWPYRIGALSLFAMAASLAMAVLALADLIQASGRMLAARWTAAAGLLAAACFFGHGVLRMSGGPLAHIERQDDAWGQAAYLGVQMAGVHGFAQGAILALCAWAVVLAVIGLRSGLLPAWVSVLAIAPLLRLVGALLGPLELLPEGLWIVFMASIVGTMLWSFALGIALLLRSGR